MTTGGWINLILSVGFVLGLFGWCAWKLAFGKVEPGREAGTGKDHLAHVEPVRRSEIADR